MTLSIFACAGWPSACLLWKNVYSDPLPIFNWVICGFFFFFLLLIYRGFFRYFGYSPLNRCMIFTYFLPFCRLSFYFVDGFLHCIQVMKLNSVQFSRWGMSDFFRPHGLQDARPPCPSPTPESNQTHVHQVGDAIQPSHPLSTLLLLPPIPPSIRVFSSEPALHIRWPKYWEFQLQHQSFQWTSRTDLL